jgi:ATP-dependent 26S proteasome regulatory subunit
VILLPIFFLTYRILIHESPCIDVGGLDEVVESMKEAVLYPLQYPSLFNRPSGLLAAPKGVLLYGPPGK